MAILL
ncbi:hypothetical protein RDI58_026470 [Solanum bulbocastanum]